ncbi:MAG: ATP-binding protein, partial [Chloroflexota bacterium]
EEIYLKNLFSPFKQIDTSYSREHNGTGLGLTICKQLVNMMGGSIEVKSKVNVGTTFTVTLPIRQDPILISNNLD